jgi:hypothetical protein
MRARGLALGLCLGALPAGACGSDAPPPPRAPAPVAGAQPADGPDDVAVATVNGRPVWGSCVAAQVTRAGAMKRSSGEPAGEDERAKIARRAALDECVAFELLAQAAEARGLARDPEVDQAARAALASRLVEVGFERRFRTPDDLRPAIDREVDRYSDQLDRPELRASAFARVEVPAGAPPEQDAAARALAEKLAGALERETGLFPVHLREAADRLAAGSGLRVAHGEFRAATREGLVPPYADALYAIPEVGRVGRATRTPWGWDVILMTRLLPPEVRTREEIAEKVFPDLRRRYFYRWVDEIRRIEIDWDRFARLVEPAAARAGGTP